ncbi:hypothetical protein BKA83DRAFT_4125439 [Pisolithus microcarpus]|nr:hypothetical protein BKA83DRAFT_4125439 [Pisolithus microcarpus]
MPVEHVECLNRHSRSLFISPLHDPPESSWSLINPREVSSSPSSVLLISDWRWWHILAPHLLWSPVNRKTGIIEYVWNLMFIVSASKSMPGVFAPEEVCLSTEYHRRASVENPTVTMQKTLESDLQADLRKVALGSTPLFQKFRKAIRSREEVTSWYRSQSSVPMDEPPLSCHLYSEAFVVKAWIWRGKAWAPIKEGDPHPHIKPSWVTKRTIVTYRSKRRR